MTHAPKELMEINIVYINIDMITQRKCFETSWEWNLSRLFSAIPQDRMLRART